MTSNPMSCGCGSTFFAMSPIVATAPDGRTMILGADARFPYVMLFACIDCGERYVYPDKMRSNGALIPASSPDALKFILEDAPDFGKSFDHQAHEGPNGERKFNEAMQLFDEGGK